MIKFLKSNPKANGDRQPRSCPTKMFVSKRSTITTSTATSGSSLVPGGVKLLFHYVIMLLVLHSVYVPTQLNHDHLEAAQKEGPPVRFLFAQALQNSLIPNVLPAPNFVESMDSLNVRENTPINEVIYTLKANIESDYEQSVRILYDIEETPLFGLEDRASGRVRVLKQIDREQTGDSVSFQVIATPYLGNRPGAQTRLNITVYILDENDNAPRIERVIVGRQDYDSQALSKQVRSLGAPLGSQLFQPVTKSTNTAPLIRLNVSEDSPIDSVVVDLIEAIDPDKASSNPLSALCLDCEPEFRLAPKTSNALNDRLDWSIVLVQPLVHVPRNNVRQLNVIVSDGKFNSSIEFEITIDDVQNRPPHFISSTTCVVNENTPIDTTILALEAIDGDALTLDDGPIKMNIQNRQASASSTGSSANNNNQQQQGYYSGRQIVYDFVDLATGRSSSRQDDFKLHPLTGQLQVANRLDREAYLDRSGVLSVHVRARELTVDAGTVAVAADDLYDSILNKLAAFIDPSENSVTVSEITVMLMDVNDNSPRWLNASEIEQMSHAPLWFQGLPSDRDPGRNYQVRVRENSLPGSPLTNKNEMFVYDLDSGDNAEFLIHLEDPFNLFDVEPKRVSGFSSVTLKLAAGGANFKQQVLDYENINQRSYIIQLYAQETKTSDQFKSKAQIQINVLDVNDNAPEFREAAYVANIREDAPAGKMVKLVQAYDRDEVSKQLRYSLHGQSSYLFEINSLSGLITVAKCEQQQQQQQPSLATRRFVGQTSNHHHQQQQQPGQQHKPCIDFETQRVHHLMVEASDGELSSKVPFVVYVEDASDNAPTFSLPVMDVVIEEGAQRIEPPIRIEATDIDQTSTLSYSIVEGNFEGFFAINNATGELQLTRAIRIPHDDLSASQSMPTGDHNLLQVDGGSLSGSTGGMPRQQQFNKMNLVVQASDGQHTTNGTIRIDILDANDNAPQFSRPAYEKEITELATRGQSVLTVRAFDLDRGNNARVSYRLERGSHSQFDINELTGEISVAQTARPFDASKRDNYTLEVVAYDHGLVSKSSSAIVVIKVLGVSRRAPEFSPQVQRVTISENTLNNTIIHRMTVNEPALTGQQLPSTIQQGQQVALMFEPGPVEGLDKNGQPVSELERLESMISVSTNTGDVAINSGLNHDLAAYINLTLYVSYRPVASFASPPLYDLMSSANLTGGAGDSGFSGPPTLPMAAQMPEETRPRSVGYLIINVMDDNDHAPVFAAPWTPSQPELSYQMLEELPVGSILTQLVASDVDSKISHYEIDPPNEYFELSSPKSGVIVNKKVIDYDTLMRQTFLSPGSHRAPFGTSTSSSLSSASTPSAALMMQSNNVNNVIQFNVIVYDSGVKQLAAKAIVSVEILPINDNECKFEHQLYEVNLVENAPANTAVARVRATDLDVGEEHSSISYQLIGEQRDLFQIDPRSGLVTVSSRGSIGLDREQLSRPVISLTVIGRDDLHHQQSQFDQQSADNDNQAFGSNSRQSRGRGGAQFAPASTSSAGRTCSTTLRIHIEDVNDNPPLFAQKVYEVMAYDTDTVDVPLVKLIVHDEDAKHNSTNVATPPSSTLSSRGANALQASLANSGNPFRILSGNVNDSFNITQSGMIYVTKPLNETLALMDRGAHSGSSSSNSQVIELRVQVKQHSFGAASGLAPSGGMQAQANVPALFTDECLVRITVMKINRYAPEWRFEANKPVPIEENSQPGSLVTQLRCTDRDFEPSKGSSSLQYDNQRRQAGRTQPTSNAQLTSTTGDHMKQPSPIRYWIKENGMNVLETSEFRLDPVSGNLITRVALDREKREFYQLIVACEDNGKPQSLESITSLYVTVSDVDDNKPEFLVGRQQQQYGSGSLEQALSWRNVPLHSTLALPIRTITFVVDEQQSKGLQVGELKAIDRDSNTKHPISYCLLEGNEFQEFVLDQLTGVLYTNQTLDREKQASYDLLVKAVNDGQTCEDHLAAFSSQNANSTQQQQTTTKRPTATSAESASATDGSLVRVRIELQDINDNAPVFRRSTFRAGVHHRALSSTLVTQVAAFDPDHEANGTLNYRISEILLYKTNPTTSSSAPSSRYGGGYSPTSAYHHQQQSKPIKLIQLPFRIDQQGNVYTQQLLTQYQLMSMFVVHIEATEMAEPWRTAATKLEIYVYETNNQLKIRINLHPRLIESHQHEVETLLSNATRYTAIINRARSYNGNNNQPDLANTKSLMTRSSSLGQAQAKIPTLDLSQPQVDSYYNQQQVPFSADMSEPVQSSNIHAIFVDNHRLVNPNLVMEKFDLTSAQLLLAGQSFGATTTPELNAASGGNQARHPSPSSSQQDSNELGALIDRVALASIQAAEYQSSGPSGLAGIDWLENPSILFVCLSSLLVSIGLIICVAGCCCTSRIKDHIIKVAMDKLVKQQALQTKINERVLAATNQAAYAARSTSNGSILNGQHQHHHHNNLSQTPGGHDFMLTQGSGFMSSFDATKGCLNNNYENMSILQRAMEAGEFFDPNYSTLNHNNPTGHLNLGAHYYDAGELESQQQNDHNGNGDKQYQLMNGPIAVDNSVVSLSLEDEDDDDDDVDDGGGNDGGRRDLSAEASNNNNNYDLTTNGDLSNGVGCQQHLAKKSKLYTNGLNGVVSSHSRLRQQIPNIDNQFSHDMT